MSKQPISCDNVNKPGGPFNQRQQATLEGLPRSHISLVCAAISSRFVSVMAPTPLFIPFNVAKH